ncbi:hypothetical protein [Microbulbifer discodermiae]|uniref:hypothetical protein n=1 Tax=Microbulbifer sp. 2201CG32-9 TaxID=3232309 RepID=UPI00345C1200
MSWMTVSDIAQRLKSASEESPLAVFSVEELGHRCEGLYDVVFANTARAQQRIEQGNSLIGVFSRPSQLAEALVRSEMND